ncbi:uncharacterized protein [Prorops nasuta]|uniref:uncharacterized protein isoform X2 n=1 Tax=Prorops nasuta TaxID=863751 RepID=UPI0034CDBA0F
MSTTDVVRITQQPSSPDEEQHGKLKPDLLYFRRRGLFKSSVELSQQGRKCTQCSAPFGRFYNTGASCSRCKRKICRQCKTEVKSSHANKDLEWICRNCYKTLEPCTINGKRVYDNFNSKIAGTDKRSHFPIDILKHSIRRAWTINGPPSRWSAPRKSSELRLYRSFPVRHHDYPDIIAEREIERDESLSQSYEAEKESVARNTDHLIFDRSDNSSSSNRNERAVVKRNEKVYEEEALDGVRYKKDRGSNLRKTDTHEDSSTGSHQDQSNSKISFLKAPKIFNRFISPENRQTPPKHGDRKSNIPVLFKRSSKEFEDIGSPQETTKRSFIPQRYRGSTDDLCRSREDVNIPSLIPKLLSPRSKEDRLKRQDSKDDIRSPIVKTHRNTARDESRLPQSPQSNAKDNLDWKNEKFIRNPRRDSKDDVGSREASSVNATPSTVLKGKPSLRLNDSWKLKTSEQGRAASMSSETKTSDGKTVKSWETREEEMEENNIMDVTDDCIVDIAKADKRLEMDVEKVRNDLLKELDDSAKDQTEKFLKDCATNLANNSDTQNVDGNECKTENGLGKKLDEFQVIRRKFSKEEFSNPDDTDETPNKRCSSHLSPEASPLSTRSSRYSPRESESEPTPALPRKTAGDSCSASQRIRDTITRTRRESNSSARYESSGSESLRPNDTKLHGYVDLARKVKFFSGNSGTLALARSDEIIHRDSATSAGEDEPHDDNHIRAGPVSSQGRTMFRRRRQFDAQGSRRRGRSHARNCCVEELSGLQSLDVADRDGRQESPTGQQGQDHQSIVDYRRLVFISSDSSSGREEDDADSSCSSSSYLNGLPRTHAHAQSLEDCDWDYFESGSLPLPVGLPVPIIGTTVISEPSTLQDWSCCPGRGSACQACGGSQGTSVLPVPVPIPVPVPYPVPIPASLWTGDFAAAASSMISRAGESHGDSGVLRLRGDPAAAWFAWHPRFNQPLHGSRLDPRFATGVFDPGTCTFRPSEDHPIASRLYHSPANTSASEPARSEASRFTADTARNGHGASSSSAIKSINERESTEIQESVAKDESKKNTEDNNNRKADEKLSSCSFDGRDPEMMYQHARENSGSSSGRSSADSSDLEDDSASHRFSRVFVVNDDSLTSDNEIEDNEDEAEDSDSAEGGVTLKSVTSLSEDGEPVILQRVTFLDEDSLEKSVNVCKVDDAEDTRVSTDKVKNDPNKTMIQSSDQNVTTYRKIRSTDNFEINEIANIDEAACDNRIELKSIRPIDPDLQSDFVQNFEITHVPSRNETEQQSSNSQLSNLLDNSDSNITSDSLELDESSNQSDGNLENVITAENIRSSTPNNCNNDEKSIALLTTRMEHCDTRADKQQQQQQQVSGTAPVESFDEKDNSDCNNKLISNGDHSSTLNSSVVLTDSTTSTENTTGSEISSDELHEYEITPANESYECYNSSFFEILGKDAKRPKFMVPLNESSEARAWKDSRDRVENGEMQSNEKKSINQQVAADDSAESSHQQSKLITFTNSKDRERNWSTSDERMVEDASEEVDDPEEPEKLNDLISTKIEAMFKNAENGGSSGSGCCSSNSSSSSISDGGGSSSNRNRKRVVDSAHDSGWVRGEGPGNGQVVGDVGEGNGVGEREGEIGEGGATRFRSVERRPSTGKENGISSGKFSTKESCRDAQQQHFPSVVSSGSHNNKYRSLVMITQESSYQPVSVITSDTTTLLQPDDVPPSGQGLAGYFQLALEASTEQPRRKLGQPQRRAPMVKRSSQNSQNQTQFCETEVDSGLSVGSASESDDVSVKNNQKVGGSGGGAGTVIRPQDNNLEEQVALKERAGTERLDSNRGRAHSQSSDENSSSAGGVVILEEGLADDDSWVEEVSHDEEEQGATTATEESSEDEANNVGDREEELRGYHRQAIDFTLHTIVEESCEESEAEPNPATGSPTKKPRPPSASELEKYFFFGLGGEGGNSSSLGSREIDSLSETSSIYSEGLESLGQDETSPTTSNPDKSNSSEGFLNSSRLEKYFLSEFLGFDQDRRDSDGSVGSDSEGRPSPEAQRRKRLVRARGTGRSHSSSLDNLLALTQTSQNLSSQNSLQDLTLNQDSQDTLSEGSSTETDLAEDGQIPAFGTDGQFDTVKRKKKKPRNLGTQSPRVPEDRNKTPEPIREMVLVGETEIDREVEADNSEDSERANTPQSESISVSSTSGSANPSTSPSLANESSRNVHSSSLEYLTSGQRSKHQSRDSGFVGSCDDLLQHQKSPDDPQALSEANRENPKERPRLDPRGNNGPSTASDSNLCEKSNSGKIDHTLGPASMPHLANPSLSRKDSFNNWSSDEETNLMMSKMRQFFKTMVANSNGQNSTAPNNTSSSQTASPAPSPRLAGGSSSKSRLCSQNSQNRTKPPQLVYFENELTRLMKTVPGIRDEQVREIVEYLSSEDTWSDSYDSSDYTSSDLEGTAGGRRSALQEQISQSCQQIISKFDTTAEDALLQDKDRDEKTGSIPMQAPCFGRDTAFVYQKLVQSFTKMAGDGVSSDASSTSHSSPPLIAKVMHHIGSRLVALMHEVSEGGPAVQHHSTSWRRYSQHHYHHHHHHHHHRTPSSASTTEDDDSTSDSTNPTSSSHLQLPRSKSHDPLLLINNHPVASSGQEGEEREASDYERFSWRGSFESALMAADSRTKLSLLACSNDGSGGMSASALAMAAKRRSAGDLLFNPKSFSREQLDRVRSCGSIGGVGGCGTGSNAANCGGSIEERIWSNRRRSSVPDANTRGESGASAGDEDTEDELEYGVGGESRATTLPRGMQSAITAATNSLPRLSASAAPSSLTSSLATSISTMHKAHSVYHFLPQHSGVKSARYRPPGFARNSNLGMGPKRAISAPGLQISASQSAPGKREASRSRRQQTISLTTDDGSSLSEACSTPIIGAGSRTGSSHTVVDMDDMDPGLHSAHMATRASLSSLGARSDSMASVYSGAGEGRCCRSVAVTGEVEFSMQYDYKHLTFEVHVTKCKNLAPVDTKRKRSDPYVKVYLLPDKSKSGKRKTKVKKHTLNPEFNETLKFHMSLSGLETRTLWLTVWHSDMFGRNDFLGEVRIPLENKIFDDPTPRWYPLQERTEPFDDPVSYKGEVIVGLKFVPPDPTQQEQNREASTDRGAAKAKKSWSRGALHVLVKEARNLQTRAKNSGTCDPFCKSYLLPDKGRSGKQKTGVIRRCGGSPVWGHTFVYKDVSLQELAERGLELTVWDHDRIASNEFLGGVRFNLGTGKHHGKPVDWMDATGRELSLWQSMLERPNFWVEGAVALRPNLHNHGKNVGS